MIGAGLGREGFGFPPRRWFAPRPRLAFGCGCLIGLAVFLAVFWGLAIMLTVTALHALS